MIRTLPMPVLTARQIRNFWAKVDQSAGEDACHPWTGARWAKGYGLFRIRYLPNRDRTLTAHRVAFMLIHGDQPAGQIIRHTCDNPPCCNPLHLLVGTAKDNAVDRDTRGRCRAGIRNAEKTHCPSGHEYTPENVVYDNGGRKCRECLRQRQRDIRRRISA